MGPFCKVSRHMRYMPSAKTAAFFFALLFTGVAAAVSTPDIDFKAVIPPPPPDDSPAGQADLLTLRKVQEYRTKAQIEEAKRVNSLTPCGFARPVFGDWLSSGRCPKTNENLRTIEKAAAKISNDAKAYWKRQRPYQRDPDIKIVVGHPGDNSYPSGHSFAQTLWAVVYSEAFPEHAEAFDALARRTQWARVMAGVHYPTDTAAGYTLARTVGREMLKDPEVQKLVREIREEINARRPTAGAAVPR